MAEFKFKKRRSKNPTVDTFRLPHKEDPVEVIGLIQGQQPMSKEEWWVSQWLDARQYGYKYQYIVFAGAENFYKIDFLVYTVPLYTMLEPLGNHWHTDRLGQDDRKRQVEIEASMRAVAKVPMQFIAVEDMINRETVEAALERIFRR
jgi:hypothetical protein